MTWPIFRLKKPRCRSAWKALQWKPPPQVHFWHKPCPKIKSNTCWILWSHNYIILTIKINKCWGDLIGNPAEKASLPLTVKCITMEATDVSPTLAWSQFPFPMSLSHDEGPLIATAIAVHPHSHPSHLVVVKLAYVTPSVTHRHRTLTCTPVSLFSPKHRLGQSPAKLFSKLNWTFVWGYFAPVNISFQTMKVNNFRGDPTNILAKRLHCQSTQTRFSLIIPKSFTRC